MNQDKIALLKEMVRNYDFTSEEQNLIAEMWVAWGSVVIFSCPDDWEG